MIQTDRLRRPLPRTVRGGVRYAILVIGSVIVCMAFFLLHNALLWFVGEAIWLIAIALHVHAWRVGRMRRKREQVISRIRSLELELGLREREAGYIGRERFYAELAQRGWVRTRAGWRCAECARPMHRGPAHRD